MRIGEESTRDRRPIVAIVQARMGSTRLPGKVLLPVLEEPLVHWCILRLGRARLLDYLVVATSTSHQDQALVDWCRTRGIACFRGSEADVLDRYYQAAREHSASTIVRVTSDCPFIDPGVADSCVEAFLAAEPPVDYVSNVVERSYPRGLDVEVFSFAALEKAWRLDPRPESREHVTPYIYRHPDEFRLKSVRNDSDLSAYRLTVDTPEDLELTRKLYAHFGHGDFSWLELVDYLEDQPELFAINADVRQKEVPS